MEFYLPAPLLAVESHLVWIGEMIPYLERSMLNRSVSMKDHIKSLEKCDDQENSNEGDLVSFTDDNYGNLYNADNPKFCNIYATRLNEASQLAYLGEYAEALEKMELLRRIYDVLPTFQRPAFEYAVDALTWSVKTLRDWTANTQTLEDPAALTYRWNTLVTDNCSKAVLKYLWGCLGSTLKITEDSLLAVFQETVTLDPGNHIWYSIVYRTMRGMRRNVLRHQNGHLEAPSELEMTMCRKAFERAPNIYLSVKDMAVMLKEMLWMRDEKDWESEQNAYVLCQHLFERALQIATHRNQSEWKWKTQVYLAEFLLFGRGSLLDQAEGKRLLDACLNEHPENTTVLHKAGKLCHYGAAARAPNYTKDYRNLELGKRMYEAALGLKPANYPCVKDYLRLLKTQQDYLAFVEVCDKAIPCMKRDYQVSDLLTLKGCVIWLFNPRNQPTFQEEACEAWLYVFTKLPEFSRTLLGALESPPFYMGRHRKAIIKWKHVITTLVIMRNKCAATRRRVITSFIQELKQAYPGPTR